MASIMSDELSQLNLDSWREMLAYYEDFVQHPDWKRLYPILRVVQRLSSSEASKRFRAGQSLWHLIISTAPKHGLEENEPFVVVTLNGDTQQLLIEYWDKTCGSILEKYICNEDDVMSYLHPVLNRLWENTKGQRAT
jgi:hypothetical protein